MTRSRAAALVTTVLVALTSMTSAAAEEVPDGVLTVTDAQLRWGLNNESNNTAHAPGTTNFFSAGKVPDPGGGGRTLRQQDWSATAGAVRIEKRRPDGSYATATWAGLTTTPDGAPLGSAGEARFSQHQVVIDGGTGEVDPVAGTATISWSGSFTVLYYSGMTMFYVADPVLEVTPSDRRLTAVVSGFAGDRTDTGTWEEVAGQRVTLAELPEADLAGEKGFSATPAYLRVRHTPSGDEVAQTRTGAWGAFPASFLRHAERLGVAPFFYSTGSSTDRFKVPLPVTVSWDAADPQPLPGEEQPEETPPVEEPELVPPPGPGPDPTSPSPPTTPIAPATDEPTPAAPPTSTATGSSPSPNARTREEAVPVAAPYTAVRQAAPELAPASAPERRAPLWPWSVGLLLMAAALALPLRRPG